MLILELIIFNNLHHGGQNRKFRIKETIDFSIERIIWIYKGTINPSFALRLYSLLSSLAPLRNPSHSNMPFKRFVEIGRVALVNYGEDYGKLVVIVDVIDQNRALVDAPDMVRSQMNFKRLSLTDIKIDIKRVPRKKELIEAMKAGDVQKKWEDSSWGRKLLVKKRRAALNDFDRFKLMLAKIKRAGLVRQELSKLKKSQS
ncbi:hypothetical protein IC575_013139 [Cucumis melo]|uniref:60S ribosomal protein L14-1-like isoform X2 n=3 Tax=Cucumis TaxID=3655 RepID=A0A1S3AWM2_CUCME|nr:60S ribosomal protein L14-1-like isoform X2 [Cucumis melo]